LENSISELQNQLKDANERAKDYEGIVKELQDELESKEKELSDVLNSSGPKASMLLKKNLILSSKVKPSSSKDFFRKYRISHMHSTERSERI
jgi:hypothetical protein